jgi:hypothetical protein
MLQTSGCEEVEEDRPRKTSFGDGRPNGPDGERPLKCDKRRFLFFLTFLREILLRFSTLLKVSIRLHRDSRNINYTLFWFLHCAFCHMFRRERPTNALTFYSLAVSLRTTRFNIKKFYTMLALC